MPQPAYADRLVHLAAIRRAAAAAADVDQAVRTSLRAEAGGLIVANRLHPLGPSSRIFVVGIGKAAPAMCRAAADCLGDRLSAGVAAVPHGQSGQAPAPWKFYQAGHPLPDAGSLAAAQAAESMLAGSRPADLLLALVSGGGSAMFEALVDGVELEDLRSLSRLLLGSGAPIEAFNTVRAALSRVKGGGLARMASPAPTVGLLVSDVVGDRVTAIASGPTVLRAADPARARQVLEAYGLWSAVPAAVRGALARRPPRPGRCPRPHNVVVASNRILLRAAARQAEALGFRVRLVSRVMQGEAREVGQGIAGSLRSAAPGTCLLMGGETTVRLRGAGRGGRNQELALAAALVLSGLQGVALMAYASDGVDGPTDAAGGVVDGGTAGASARAGQDPRAALERNDSYTALDAAAALIRGGPTGTNLADLVVGLRYAA